ncbi:MAG TPA: LCP family protein [Acidimicrobiales bacterium]|nr:LCP family protein [Acidimicrobiales bacterium]
MRRAVLVAAAVLATAVAGALLAAPGRAAPPAVEIHKVDAGSFSPRPGTPVFMLALGLDGGRPGIDGDRSDAIHLIGVNPSTGTGSMLNIPRDTYVNIPGHGQSKINDAYALGGPDLAARTIEQLTGAHVSFVLGLRFDPFQQLVDEVGGLDVNVPMPMHDHFSGADFNPGPAHLSGAAALSFARDRHLDGGDLTRSDHQGLLILAALAKVRGEHPGATGVAHYLAVLGRHVSVSNVTPLDLYRLGRLALTIDPAAIRSVVLPARLGQVGPASVVFVGPGADSLFADLRDDAVLQAH